MWEHENSKIADINNILPNNSYVMTQIILYTIINTYQRFSTRHIDHVMHSAHCHGDLIFKL